jgi:hypothetical protein
MPGQLFADDEARRFRDAQQAALDRARDLPAEEGRAELARLVREEAAWRAARTRAHERDHARGRGVGMAL